MPCGPSRRRARCGRRSRHRLDGFGADVVGIFDRADQPAAVERNVEFARQIVERAIVDDDLRELLAEGHDIDQFVRIDAGGGIGRQVADVVRARAARVQARRLDAAQNFGRVLRLDQADLEIGASGDLDVAGGEFFGDRARVRAVGKSSAPARNAKPRHERSFVRREKKKAVPFEAE